MREALTSVLVDPGELPLFLSLLVDTRGDPAASVCQVFVPWRPDPPTEYRDVLPEFDHIARILTLEINDGAECPVVHLPIARQPVISERQIEAFAFRRISRGVWALEPSLNMPGVMHAFLVFHGVPDPAPWEGRIILCDAAGRELLGA